MKLSATGQIPTRSKPGPRAAFTLVELVIVMSLMVIAISTVAPELRGFLKSRDLDSEAQRFLSVTRFGANRAVSEGLPVELWINVKQGRYGMAASGGYTESKTNALNFYVNNETNIQKQDVTMLVTQGPGTLIQSNFWTPFVGRRSTLSVIRFQPDGFISYTSPQTIKFQQGTSPEVWIVENTNHTRYGIEFGHAKSTK